MRLILLLIVFIQLKESYEQFPNQSSNNIIQNGAALQPAIYELRRVPDSEVGLIKPDQILNVRQERPQTHIGTVVQKNNYGNPQQTLTPFASLSNRQSYLPNSAGLPQQTLGGPNVAIGAGGYQLPQDIDGYKLVHSGEPTESGYNQVSDFQQNQNQVVHVPPPPPFQNGHQLSQIFNEQNHIQTPQNLYGSSPVTPQNIYHQVPLNQPTNKVPQSFNGNSPTVPIPALSRNPFLPSQNFQGNIRRSSFYIPPQNVYQPQNGSPGTQVSHIPQNPLQYLPQPSLQLGQHYVPSHQSQLVNQQYHSRQEGRKIDENNEYFETVEVSMVIPGNEHLRGGQEFRQSQSEYNPQSQSQIGHVNDEGYQVVNEGYVPHVVSIENSNQGSVSNFESYHDHQREKFSERNNKQYIQIQNE